jgi:hypothetical protein
MEKSRAVTITLGWARPDREEAYFREFLQRLFMTCGSANTSLLIRVLPEILLPGGAMMRRSGRDSGTTGLGNSWYQSAGVQVGGRPVGDGDQRAAGSLGERRVWVVGTEASFSGGGLALRPTACSGELRDDQWALGDRKAFN